MAKILDPTRKTLKEIGNQWSDVSVAETASLCGPFSFIFKDERGKDSIYNH